MTLTRTLPAARALTVLVGAAMMLAACNILPTREPVQLWQPPETSAAPATSGPTADFSLRIDTPNAAGPLARNGIVVWPSPGKLSTYAGARWSEPPAELLQRRLVDAFMAAQLPAVTTDDDRFAADYALSGNLRAFQTEYRDGSPEVVVRYDAQLRRGFSRTPLATRSFVVTRRPAGSQVPQVVDAFGAANDQLASEIVPWVIDTVRRAPPAEPDAAPPHWR